MPIKTNLTSLEPTRSKMASEIQLPSGGYVSPNSFPNGKITVFPWDAFAEELFIDMAQTGAFREHALFDIVPSICNLKECSLGDFIASEALLIVMISRSLSNRGKLDLVLPCPKCGHVNKMTVAIPDDLRRRGEKPEGYPGTDVVVLKESGDHVRIHPLTVASVKKGIQRDKDEVRKVPHSIYEILHSISAIGDGKDEGTPTDEAEVLAWFRALSPADSAQLRKAIGELTPGVDPVISVKCDKCGHVFNYGLSLETDFFR